MKSHRALLLAGVALASFSSLYAATIHVPADQPTIQAGINAAVDGDTVLVAPGTYLENIVISKSITLQSEGGASATTLVPQTPGISLVSAVAITVTVEGFTFRDCSAQKPLCFERCELTFKNNVVTSITGSKAPMYVSGVLGTLQGKCLIENSDFYNNHGTENGAALCLIDMVNHCVVESCRFWNNTGANGGGITLWSVKNARVSRNLIHHNVVPGYGGGIACVNTSGNDSLTNNTVAYNQSGLEGGGIFSVDIAKNNIVVFNQGGNVGGICGGVATIERDYNDVYQNVPQNYDGSDGPGEHAISADPLFVDVTSSGYKLTSSSQCINAGDPDPQYNDPDGSRNDMGAFLYVSPIKITGLLIDGDSSATNVVSHDPLIEWEYVTLQGLPAQTAFEIAVGTDPDWAYSEMWNPAPFNSSDTFVVYNGAPLVDGTTYWLRLRVNNSLGWSDWKQILFHLNTVPTVPQLRLPLPGALVSSQQPSLIIRNCNDAESDSLLYTFEVSPDNFAATVFTFTKKQDADLLTTLTVDSTLIENGQYWWRVKASDYYESSEYSPVRSFWVDAENTIPTAFALSSPDSGLTTPLTTLLPQFTWVSSSDPDPLDSVRYTLFIAIDQHFNFAKQIPDLTATSYTLTDSLTWGTRYWWKVKVNDLNGGSIWSTQVFTFRTMTLGDADGDGSLTIADIVFLINYIFMGGAAPQPISLGEIDCSGSINIADCVYLINYVFSHGPAPCDSFPN